ncbi:MAG TPA: alpha-amylase/4-alpha-glucanotransferase domain-containing protein [Candidatus Edwardsbacteria bacterium]|nr:alpha-amylase/4-alpha-glucanotransferase domain-containing protein [Candidatus Edwardsbacteria bacterium]
MSKVTFIFGVHNHQPVGNFDFVFEEAYQQAYQPFLNVVKDFPWFKFTLHNSGCLWEWLKTHHSEYFDAVGAMKRAGQVELMGGAFYEPILPAIPERDRQGQIAMMSEFLKTEFGVDAEGAWVAERVWEPGLASTLADAGIKYVALDDAHFKSAGKFDHQLRGHYLTDDQGQPLAVFPISQKLRYLVPFHQVGEVIDHLKSLRSEHDDVLAILADDGEKFGVWPGTHELAYTKGWLREFLSALERNRDWLAMATFGEALRAHRPLGRIYLPTGSYTEMGEWVLEPEAEAVYRELAGRLKKEGSYERYMPFVKGGIWRNFLTKYPESNNIYRKMLHVSAKARAAGPGAVRDLYRGQCNCAYWHGVFGGLYLPHLREALYKSLIRAEQLCDGGPWPKAEQLDFDGDGFDEVLLSNEHINLYLAPAQGGTVFEWDLKRQEYNLFDTLARRRENYHATVGAHSAGADGGGKSIHEMMVAKEAGLEKLLVYDDCRRVGLVSRLLAPQASLEDLISGQPYGELLGGAWRSEIARTQGSIAVSLSCDHRGVLCRKTVTITEQGEYSIELTFANNSGAAAELRPALEFNVGLLSSGPGRYCRSAAQALSLDALDRPAADHALTQLSVHDDHRGTAVDFAWDRPMDLWRYPVQTVSQSEAGLERNYQCSCFLWHTRIALAANQTTKLSLRIGSRRLA